MRTISRDIVGGVILSADNKVLLGKTGVYDGLWVVPGGGVNEGETKLEALKREILEETGLNIDTAQVEEIDIRNLGESEKTLRTGERVIVKMQFFDYKMIFPQPAEQLPVTPQDDLLDARWFSAEELKSVNLAGPTKSLLEHVKFLKKATFRFSWLSRQNKPNARNQHKNN